MKTWVRTTQEKGYQNITTVTESGDYIQVSVCKDGTILNQYKTTLQAMGWKTVREFLKNRKGFVKED